MSITQVSDVVGQQEMYWSARLTKELRASMILGSFVSKEYDGEIKEGGNVVRVSQINAPTGQLLTIGTDADSFAPEKLVTQHIDITANKVAVASHKFTSYVDMQTQLGKQKSEIMAGMTYALDNQINTHLYSLIAASTSAPDHNIGSVTDFNAAQVSAARLLASTAKWGPQRYCLVDPSYMSDLQNAATLTSSDYVGGDNVVVNGKNAFQRFGFSIFEDNNMKSVSGAAVVDHALIFVPDFMHLVMQQSVQVKISDLHPLGQFGYLMSASLVFGAALGIDGAKKHIQVYNSAW